ncbi:MAG: DUF1206 domain-containing protein [Deltaproteobacteria bacterium]|nr:DUF1206 domain-containing protein [Deltaproteobacteria bacterium]
MITTARNEEQALPSALARFGFLSRGIVYVLIGGIAARAAILQRGRATGPAGALARILTGSGGRLLLWIVVAGLFAFVLFRVVQGVRTRRRLAQAFSFMSALGGLVLAIAAARVLLQFRSGADEAGLRELAGHLVSHAWGRLGLELGGAIAIVVGGVEAVRAVLGRLPADFATAIMARARRKWTSVLTRVGMLAHGVVVAVIGFSACRAGLDESARTYGGTGPALRTLRHSGSGPVLFGLVAVGLIAYGLSLLVLVAHPRLRSR